MSPPVVFDSVEKIYASSKGRIHALGPVSLTFEPMATTAIVGPSGCGKSTLLRLMAGLERSSRGTILVGEKRVTDPLTDVGIVFQRDLLLDWRTVLDNTLLPAELKQLPRKEMVLRAQSLLNELGVGDFADRRPWELSGGMRQRVAIARALLCHPSLLLLDEPFSALDALTRDQMGVILQRAQGAERVTTLLITHSIQEAVLLSDRVLVMSGRPGRVLDDIAIPFPRPRPLSLRESPEFGAIAGRIRTLFEQTGVLAA